MPDQISAASFLRTGSVRFLVCGALLFAILFMAHFHTVAVLIGLATVAAAGAVRRSREIAVEHGHPDRPGAPAGALQAGKGVADQQTLAARLEAEWNREQHAGGPTSLLLIGVDAYQQLYDKSRALAGDVAMLTLSNALARMLPRRADLVARYNESTFAVLLSGTDLPGSLRVAARLRWAIIRLGIANPQTDSGFLTTCMGLAVQHGIDSGGAAVLLAAAESALAAAERAGHDSLEYRVLGAESQPDAASAHVSLEGAVQARLPAIRAWTTERATAMHSPQS